MTISNGVDVTGDFEQPHQVNVGIMLVIIT